MSDKDLHKSLEAFVKERRDKTIMYLKRNFEISEADCEDIFQDSFMILYGQTKEGRLDGLTSSLATYFTAICRNKTMEVLRSRGRYVHAPHDDDDVAGTSFLERKVDAVLSLDGDDLAMAEKKEAIVRDIVRDLPSPCEELLWGFYRDGMSLKALADRFGYASEGVVKVTKHRCCDKFKKRFSEMLNKIL